MKLKTVSDTQYSKRVNAAGSAAQFVLVTLWETVELTGLYWTPDAIEQLILVPISAVDKMLNEQEFK